jgi:hypothetical protein
LPLSGLTATPGSGPNKIATRVHGLFRHHHNLGVSFQVAIIEYCDNRE